MAMYIDHKAKVESHVKSALGPTLCLCLCIRLFDSLKKTITRLITTIVHVLACACWATYRIGAVYPPQKIRKGFDLLISTKEHLSTEFVETLDEVSGSSKGPSYTSLSTNALRVRV